VSLADFLSSLWESGRVVVPAWEPLKETALREAEERLRDYDQRWRATLVGEPPAMDAAAARWGAVLIFRACQLVTYRDIGPEQVEHAWSIKPPAANSAESHYRADLSLKFLPDVLRLARAATEEDPLVGRLERLACEWPLSSVGVAFRESAAAAISEPALHAILTSPSLRMLYLDRVLARQDVTRLADPRVRQEARRALGMYLELAPKIAAALGKKE
jgi:hypothetical protein